MVKEKEAQIKETTAKLEAVERDRNDLVNAIVETRATPEQYVQSLEYLRLANSANRADRELALDYMVREMAALARALGKPVPGVNMLEGHNDLIDEVATGRLSPERAQEIAAARSAAQHDLRVGQQEQERARTQQHHEQLRAQGIQSLNALGAQLKAADGPVYEAKRKLLVNALKPVFQQIPPNQWAATYKRAYDNLVLPPAPPPPTPSLPKVPQNTPLRPGNPAGAALPEPKSALDALNLGVSQAG